MTDRQDTSPGMDPARPGGQPGYAPTPSGASAYPAPGNPHGGTGYDTDPVPGPGTDPRTAVFPATPATTPDYSPRPVAVRRADVLAGLLLLLAGAAAAISLLFPWLAGRDDIGLDLVRRGVDDARDGFGTVIDTGFWQPLTVVGGGALLLVLGLLVLLPAKRHRLLGLLALLVTAAVAADVPEQLSGGRYDVAAGEVSRVR
jgi:hypothetical protein